MPATLTNHDERKRTHPENSVGTCLVSVGNPIAKFSSIPDGKPISKLNMNDFRRIFSSALLYFTGPTCTISTHSHFVHDEVTYHECKIDEGKYYACYVEKV